MAWSWMRFRKHENIFTLYIYGLVQERRNSIAIALELRQSCTKPSIYSLSLSTRGVEIFLYRRQWQSCMSRTMTADALATQWARTPHQQPLHWNRVSVGITYVIWYRMEFKCVGKYVGWISTVLLNWQNVTLALNWRFIISMANCKNAFTPLLTHWSYYSFELSHRYVLYHDIL